MAKLIKLSERKEKIRFVTQNVMLFSLVVANNCWIAVVYTNLFFCKYS